MRSDERFYTSAYTFLRMWRPRHRPYGRIMEHGSRRLTAGQATRPTSAGSTVTQAVFGAVAEHTMGGAGEADRPAVIDAMGDRPLTYAELAAVVPTVAAGLARRGVLTGDVAAVYLPHTWQLTLAVHALTAAGAVPAPIPRAGVTSADDLAELLTSYDARMLVTAPPLGEVALDAADRSYVRQVFAFGDVPGATPFGELLRGGGPSPRIDPGRDYALIQPIFRSGGASGAVGAVADGTTEGGLDGPGDGTADQTTGGSTDGVVGDQRERLTHADRLADLDRLAAAVAVARGEALVGVSVGCSAATWVGLIDVALLRGATFVAVTLPGSAPLLRAIETYDAEVAVVAPVTLQTLAREEAVPPRSRHRPPRLLVAGPAPEELVRACRRHDWCVDTLV